VDPVWQAVSCFEVSTHWLIAPDGAHVAGAYVCERHGREAVEEYRAKLGEEWGLAEIVRAGC
jgi:hypothetical protein